MDVRDYIDSNARESFDQLKAWLAIPPISADPGHHGAVRSSAQWLAAHLTATGFPTVEIWDTGAASLPGQPAVFAHWPALDPAAPSVLVYGHHDVQPVEPLGEWHSPPFQPAERDGHSSRAMTTNASMRP
jgi:acetylornithine deacetylase/succinyl-diaminopimelate desuccinylase-like protein